PALDAWSSISRDAAPSARAGHTATWTGAEMLVWGGQGADGMTDTGGRYDPAADSWSPLSATGAPSPRIGHTATWTGSQLVVWGGLRIGAPPEDLQSGGRYDPASDAWATVSTSGAPSAREYHSAGWTGSKGAIWGGFIQNSTSSPVNTGALYDPGADAWMPISPTGAPSPRPFHTAVWAADRMVVWGGGQSFFSSQTGGRYDPATDTWLPTATVGAPLGHTQHGA